LQRESPTKKVLISTALVDANHDRYQVCTAEVVTVNKHQQRQWDYLINEKKIDIAAAIHPEDGTLVVECELRYMHPEKWVSGQRGSKKWGVIRAETVSGPPDWKSLEVGDDSSSCSSGSRRRRSTTGTKIRKWVERKWAGKGKK